MSVSAGERMVVDPRPVDRALPHRLVERGWQLRLDPNRELSVTTPSGRDVHRSAPSLGRLISGPPGSLTTEERPLSRRR